MKYQSLYYALESQYNKTNKSKSFSEYVANWFGKTLSKALLEYGNAVYDNPLNQKSTFKPEYGNTAEFILDNALDPILDNCYVEDKLKDIISDLIEKNKKAILTAHPEMKDSEESFYYE